MTSLYKHSVLVFGNSSISNSLCHILSDDFSVHYLPKFPILETTCLNALIEKISSRPWMKQCNIISSISCLNALLQSEKLLAILSSSSSESLNNFSAYIQLHSVLKIFHMTSSQNRLDRLLELLHVNVIPCYPNIATEFKRQTLRIVGNYIVDIPAECLSESTVEVIESFNLLSSSVSLNTREMRGLFRARFLMTSYTYADLLSLLSPFAPHRHHVKRLDELWGEHEKSITAFEEYKQVDRGMIRTYSQYISKLDPNLSDIAWIVRVLVFDKSYKMERFIHAVERGI